MAVEVRLPTVLRSHAGGASAVTVDGATIGEVLAKLVAEYPGHGRPGSHRGRLAAQVRERLRDDDDVRYLRGPRHQGGRRRHRLDPARRRGRLSGAVGGSGPDAAPWPVRRRVLDLIGNTPLVDVSALSPNPAARILIKLEGQNPGGSVKDRVALSMIEDAEQTRRARARAADRSSWSRRRATPASAWPWCAGSRATT